MSGTVTWDDQIEWVDDQVGLGRSSQRENKHVPSGKNTRIKDSQGELIGRSKRHQLICRKKARVPCLLGKLRTFQELAGRSKTKKLECPPPLRWPKLSDIEFAEIALNFYHKKKQDPEFEIVEVMYVEHMEDHLPKVSSEYYNYDWTGPEGTDFWCHVGFTAKPKNSSCCSDVSPKHFFGELKLDDATFMFNATYCTIVDPSEEMYKYPAGECMFCPSSDRHFHPLHSQWACVWVYANAKV